MPNPLIGFYDTPIKQLFEPLIAAKQCTFSCYPGWMHGESTCLSKQNAAAIGCPGAGYWNCNVEAVPSQHVAHFLAVNEGRKASSNLMIDMLAPCTDVIWIYGLNIINRSDQIWLNLQKILNREFPDLLERIEPVIFSKEHTYWAQLRDELVTLKKEQQLNLNIRL